MGPNCHSPRRQEWSHKIESAACPFPPSSPLPTKCALLKKIGRLDQEERERQRAGGGERKREKRGIERETKRPETQREAGESWEGRGVFARFDFSHAPAMVSDQEIASCVESVLRGSAGSPVEASLATVLQQAEAKLGMDLSNKASFIRDQMDLFFGPRLQAPPPKALNPPLQVPVPQAQPQGQVVTQVPAQPQVSQQMQQQLTALQPQLIFQPMTQLPAVVPGSTVSAVSTTPAVPAMAFYPPPPLAFRYTTGLGGAATGGTVSFQQPAPGVGSTASPTAAVQAAGDNKERWSLHLIRVFVPQIELFLLISTNWRFNFIWFDM
jgi:hypothetical protein